MSWRRNPKTPDGWFKRGAIAVLAGFATFLLVLPVSFFLLLHHFQRSTPQDTQNLLSALTFSVVLGLAIALLAAVSTLAVFALYKSLGRHSLPGSSFSTGERVDR